ncbi:SA1320 family protein [Metabacillus sp. 84]|uniref:SA1320 family protein n=1 Tax=Metabacillus sp. 84 TaxID=3404705 RepID=UPI003CE8C05F
MSTEVSKNISLDKDLVELSGNAAYSFPLERQEFDVNDSSYLVVDTTYNSPSGFDALTVKNVDTDEYSIIFIGTEPGQDKNYSDIYTDVQLLTDLEIQQIKEANEYYEKMEKEYEPLTSVAGNSLAGGLALSVGINNPDLKAVAYNPAPLPKGMVDPEKDYPNMTSYFGMYDPLTGALVNVDLADRVPGNHITINNGLPGFEYSANNHTGYGNPKNPLIDNIGADEFIAVSIWTGEPLYGAGASARIRLDKDALTTLVDSLDTEIKDRALLISKYVAGSETIVQSEADAFNRRIEKLQEILINKIEATVGDPAIQSLTKTGEAAKSLLTSCSTIIDVAEDLCRGLNNILNSPPSQLVEFITSTDISVESLFSPLRKEVNHSLDAVTQTTSMFSHIIEAAIPLLIRGGTDFTNDAVVNEYNAHYQILQKNTSAITSQIEHFKTQISSTANEIFNREENIKNNIANGTGAIQDIGFVPEPFTGTMEESPYFQFSIDLKDLVFESGYDVFKTACTFKLLPVLVGLEGLLTAAAVILQSIIFAVKGASAFAVSITPDLLGLFNKFDAQIKNLTDKIVKKIDEALSLVEGLQEGIAKLIIHFPQIIEFFQPYFETAIFETSNYRNVQLYNQASLNTLEYLNTIFKDIIFQLSDHESNAITALCDISRDLTDNFDSLKSQIECCTVNQTVPVK